MSTTIVRERDLVVTRFYGGHAFGQLVEVYRPSDGTRVVRFPTEAEKLMPGVYTD